MIVRDLLYPKAVDVKGLTVLCVIKCVILARSSVHVNCFRVTALFLQYSVLI